MGRKNAFFGRNRNREDRMPRQQTIIQEIEDAIAFDLDAILLPISRIIFHPLVLRYHPLAQLMRCIETRNAPGPNNNGWERLPT
jgi:hypothetical protein